MSFSDLPYVQEIVDASDCLPSVKCSLQRSKIETHMPDERLKNWNRWMLKRKDVNETLSEALKLKPGQLLLNYSEDLRSIKEEKVVFEYTRIPHPHDHYRGNPSFWTMPATLTSKCPKKQSYYFKTMTKDERCEIPEIEYVNVPSNVRKEKGSLATGYRNQKDIWDKSTYRQQKTDLLKTELKHVQPHKPDLKDIFIQGISCNKIQKKNKRHSISETQTPVASIDSKKVIHIENIEQDYVEINGIKITATATNNIYLIFDYDLNSRKVATQYLTLKNGSFTALRYHFRKCEKQSLFKDIIQKENDEIVFVFRHNMFILMPQSEVQIPIHFKSKTVGTFKESWEFQTNPWNIKCLITLEAIASYADLEARCDKIKETLNLKAKAKVIKDNIDEILSKIPMPSGKPVIYTYDKAMIFEAVNQDFNPIASRPKYLYNKTIVGKLEKFYDKVRLSCHPTVWNYNIENLKSITKQRERFDYEKKVADEILSMAYTNEKKEKEELTDENVKKDALSSKDPRKKSTVVVEDVVKNEKFTYLDLEELLMKLEQPSVWVNLDQNKYEWSYVILCTHIDSMCKEAEDLKKDWCIKRISAFPELKELPTELERRQFEHLEDLSPPHSKIVSYDFNKADKPPPECLTDIPIDDSMRRYRAYYNILEEEPKKEGKKEKGKKEKGKKGDKKGDKKDDKKSKKEKSSKDKSSKGITDQTNAMKLSEELFKINENFDPYEEIDLVSLKENLSVSDTQTIEQELCKDDEMDACLLEQYKMNLYFIFYKHLEDAVCRIADVCEHEEKRRLKLGLFKRILETNEIKATPVKIAAIDLRGAIETGLNVKKPADKEYTKKQRQEKIQRRLSEIKTGDKKSSTKESQRFYQWTSEILQEKEPSSLWSILQEPKKPEPPDKPISYPETRVRTKYNRKKPDFIDFGNVMSNAGIDPNWEDFKEVGVQVSQEEENDREKELHIESIIDTTLQKVYEVAKDKSTDSVEVLSEEVFYDEDVPIIKK